MRASLLPLGGDALRLSPSRKGRLAIAAVTIVLAMLTEAFRPAAMSFFAETVEPARRKSAFAVYRLAINLGMAIGPAIGGILATIAFRYLFFVDGATSHRRRPRPRRRRAPATAEKKAIASAASPAPTTATRLRLSTAAHADPRFLFFLAGVLPVMVIFFQHISSMPLYIVDDLGFTPRTFGLLFSLNCLLIVLLEIPLNAARRTGPTGARSPSARILSGAGFGAMAFARDFWSLAGTVVIWTFGEMLFFPASAAYATDIAPDARRGEYSGLYTMVVLDRLRRRPVGGDGRARARRRPRTLGPDVPPRRRRRGHLRQAARALPPHGNRADAPGRRGLRRNLDDPHPQVVGRGHPFAARIAPDRGREEVAAGAKRKRRDSGPRSSAVREPRAGPPEAENHGVSRSDGGWVRMWISVPPFSNRTSSISWLIR